MNRMLEPDKNKEAAQLESISKSEPAFLVYPNPVKDKLVVRSSGFGAITEIKIYDVFGQLVVGSSEFVEKKFPSPNYELNTTNLPAGVYFLEAFSNKQKQVRKFVKELE